MGKLNALSWSLLSLLLALATGRADDATPGVALEAEPRSVANPAWIASGMVAKLFSQAIADAGPSGPERVRKMWYLTCVFDAWAAGKIGFDDAADEYGDACAQWCLLPTTAMQARGEPTPNTEGKNAQMIFTAYGTFFQGLKKMFPKGSAEQHHAATGCAVDLYRSKGMEAAGAAIELDGPCLRYAGLTSEQTKSYRKAKKTRTEH